MKRYFLILVNLLIIVIINSAFNNRTDIKRKKDGYFHLASRVENRVNDCRECHADIYNKKHFHAPAKESCENCHENNNKPHPSDSEKNFILVEKGSELCIMCHDVNSKKHVHYPISEENCNICHSPHSSDYPKLLIQYPTSNLCKECHEPNNTEELNIHAPYDEGDCSLCHDAHHSDHKLYLKESTNKLCIECHSDIGDDLQKEFIHYPADEDCLTCHKAHSSKEEGLLIQKEAELCYTCHEAFNTKKHVHTPISKGECKSCHNSHGSAFEKILNRKEEELCISCHQKTIWKEFKNEEQVEKNLVMHGAIELGGCSTCHKAHSSEINSLLKASFPEGLYALAVKENFGMCFDCHDSEMLNSENSRITGFRNGEQNLHYLHINGEKGRNCINCHDMHSSVNDHLILKTVLFGNWEMPLKYQSTENGGSCSPGCHGEAIYVR